MTEGHKGQALKFAQIAQLYRLVSAVSFMSNMCNLFHTHVSVPRYTATLLTERPTSFLQELSKIFSECIFFYEAVHTNSVLVVPLTLCSEIEVI